jgi:hypothetical protein
MSREGQPTLKIVDGLTLSAEHRALLRPGEAIADERGRLHRLPRFFYQVDSWEQARGTPLTAHFTLAELIAVDCREADLLLRKFPHFVPCAVSILARYLEEFRARVEAPVIVGVNGGYRSPAHRLTQNGSPHLWAAAADIYRIGDAWLDSEKTIERYARVAEGLGQEVFVKRFGHGEGETDDHLHLDLGHVHWVPRELGEGGEAGAG